MRLRAVFESEVQASVSKALKEKRMEYEVNTRVAAELEKQNFEFEITTRVAAELEFRRKGAMQMLIII
jgi:hypothetical protein